MPNLGATPDPAVELLGQDRTVLVAPAGCGKTEVIARALLRLDAGRHLVLTHTHAGVGALKARLLRLRVPPERYRIDTIASWSLRVAAHYPALSGLGTSTPVGPDWNKTYPAALRLLQTRTGKAVVANSYSSVFVDEYQDCVADQHSLVMALANLMPCRIVGDPLQGIFGFRNNRLVSWATEVYPNFHRITDLSHPWRWHGKNAPLGAWLLQIRPLLETGQAIDLTNSPVNWRAHDDGAVRAVCLHVAGQAGSAVALRKWAPDCHQLASKLRGRFTSMEEMDCKDLMTAARALANSTGLDRVSVVIETASACMTKVTTSLRAVTRAVESGRSLASCRARAWPEVRQLLLAVETTADLAAVERALHAMSQQHGVVVYRRELLGEIRRTLVAFSRGGYATLEDAAWAIRNRTRLSGRNVERRVVSRTLLVKGLEFDHAVVANADELDVKNLYVALTRGSTSVTVTSGAQRLSPRP
jgi:DNA helicase-2/ATP-dependent DNA helicase PcrA